MLVLYSILGAFMLLVWPLLILLHELGHAVPALLFTRRRVTVYLGSYGDQTNSWQVQIGLLEFYLKRRPIWSGGLCIHDGQDLPKVQHVTIVLGGVVVSLAVAMLGFYAALVLNLHGSVKLFMFLLVGFATVSLVQNLVPSKRGGLANDGLLLKWLLLGQPEESSITFSPELKQLIGQSREIAIDLGYEYVSTLHMLLADCALPYPYSLAGLFFHSPDARQAFYEQQRVGPPLTNIGSLPLTAELEQALRQAHLATRHGFRQELYPCHLLVAASEVAGSALREAVPASTNLSQQLLDYYRGFEELWATR